MDFDFERQQSVELMDFKKSGRGVTRRKGGGDRRQRRSGLRI